MPQVRIAAGPNPVAEGAAATFILTRTGPTGEALTVAVSVTEGGAMLAANPPASVIFGTGEISATLTAATEDDAVVEEASAVTAAIASSEGYTAAADAGSAQVSVEDNDAATFEVSFEPEAIAEGQAATLTVEIANGVTFAEDQAIALDFAGGTAAKGTDYTLSAEALALAAGSTSVQATVTAVDDTDPEGAETVAVAARHEGAAIGSASMTIEASDAALPEISIAVGTSPVEEGAAATFILTRTGPATEALAVAVSVTESAAMLGANPAASVTFGADESSATLTVATDDDAVVEGASAVTAAVASGEGYSAAADAGSAEATVEDNDAPVWTVSPSAVEVAEGDTATLTVSVGAVTFAEAQVLELRTAGTADAVDFALSPPTPQIAAGAGSVAVSVTAVDDAAEEKAETVRLTVLHGGGEVGTATVTIAANDAATGDARLADLTLSGGEFAFRGEVERYAMTVPKDLESTTVTATPNDPDAAVDVSPADTDSDPANGHQVRLAEGANAVVVTVVSEDGQATKTYTVQVTRLAADRAEALRRPERDLEDLSGNVPFGLWSEDGTLWSAMWWSVGLVAFDLETHGRLSGRDIAVASDNPSPTGLWSDGETLWASDYGGGVYAYRLADGERVPGEDLAATLKAAGNDTPTGLWSDGETLWVADHYDERVYAYRLADKAQDEDREFALDEGTRAFGLWSDGTTVWTADLSDSRVAAYRLADGSRDADRDYDTSTVGNDAPVSLWSDGETLWVGDRYDEKLYAYALEAEASADATLASLTLSGVDIGAFDATTTDYAASVGPAVASTTVTATPTSAGASVTIADSDGSMTDGPRDVSLAVGANTITATVTAADGQTTATYTVTVMREYAALPEISIAAGTSPVTEGTAASFTLTRTGPTAEALTLTVSVTESGAMLAANSPASVTFGVGESSVTLTAATDDDGVVEAASAVTAAIANGEGYSAAAAAGSAQVSVEDNDAASFEVSFDPEAVAEGQAATLTVAIANGVTFAEGQTIALEFAGGTAAHGTDYTVSSESLALAAGATAVRTMLTAVDDTDPEGAETVAVTARHGGAAIGSASMTIEASDAALPEISISAGTSPVTEGAAATFTLTRTGPTAEALTVAVSVTEGGAMLAANPPASVTFGADESSATLTAATEDDAVAEGASAVTAAIASGEGYSAAADGGSAQVTVEDNDTAAFTVTAVPEAIAEGESATLTVAIANGVTFAEDQTVALALSGTASAADYAGLPAALTLQAGASSTTAELTASEDRADEEPETVMVAASHGGVAIGSATVTIRSVSHDATLAALTLSGVDIGTFASSQTSYMASVAHGTSGTTVTATATHPGATVAILPGAEVSLAEGANEIAVTVTAENGKSSQTYTVTVTRAGLPEVSIAGASSPVTEGTAAVFEVTLGAAAPGPLTVAVSVAESGSALSGTPPASVSFAQGDTSATLSVPTSADSVVEADSAVTATVTAGPGYTVGAASSATVTVEDNDEAAFTVTAAPEAIAEGESATLTVAISNGATFAEDQSVALSVSGTASPADYSGLPAALTLAAGASAVTAELAAEADQAEEEAETVTVAAAHAGVSIGSATVTIRSVSHDATLAALSLSGVDIGTFASDTTVYTASVAHDISSTTVTAAATHPRATVSILPSTEVSLAEGANEIAVTVTAEDGKSTQTYTVTVARVGLPVVSIVAVASPVSEGERVAFTVSRTGPTTKDLTVQASWSYSDRAEVQTIPVLFQAGRRSKTPYIQEYDDKVVREDVTVTLTLEDGEGYTVAAGQRSAEVVLEENDTAQFALSLDPGEIAEGQSATVRIGITNGVTFEEDQTINLDFAGSTATGGTDFTVSPESPTLPAGARSVTATLDAALDTDDEGNETVTVAAAHGGVSIGSATVTIAAVSHDATLGALSLSGVDIGTFASGETSYAASVAHATSSTTVTATPTHPGASVSILPGTEVSLAEGVNEIAVTVTAEDGRSTQTYTVTVTRAGLPVVSIVAVASPVSEGERVAFTVSRTGPMTQELTVQASWSYSDRAEVQTMPVLFQAGRRSKTPHVQKHDDKVIREDVTVTLTLEDGEGYTVSAEARSAQVVLEDNDVAQFALSLDPGEIAEGESGTVRVEITNGVTFEEDQAITFEFAGSTATKGADYAVSPESLTMRSRADSAKATVTALDDTDEESDETVSVTAKHAGETIGTATLTITNRETAPLTAQFVGVPESHDGQGAVTFKLHFSEEPELSYLTLRDHALQVTGGAARTVEQLASPSNLRWQITVEPASGADVTVVLPASAACDAPAAICTTGGKPLSSRLEATIKGPGSESSGEGFSLAPANSSPSGLWSDGDTAWVADLEDARLYAYRSEDGERLPDRDIATGPAPMGLWSDGKTLWVAGLGGGLHAHRLSNGARLVARDLALKASAAPAGVWSDGKTLWVSDWLGETVHAYRLANGQREAGRDIRLAGGNLMPVGLWSDGETLWVADWRELLYAYRLSDGGREPSRDVVAGAADSDPTGLWSGGGTLLATSWEGSKVRAYRLPALPVSEGAPGKGRGGFLPARAASLPAIADAALKTAIGAALGKALGEAVSLEELAGLEALEAREAGIRELAGLEAAASLKKLDLGFNPLADLRPLAALPRLESLNLDGAVADLQELAALASVKRLSLRHNGIEDLGPLAGLAALAELDVGDNRIGDLSPLAGLASLAVLRADRNLIADLWPLAPLSGLEVLDLGANQVRDLQPLAGLARLRMLRLAGNGLAELHPLSRLEGLQDLGLGGNAVEDLHALSGLSGLRRLDLRGNPVRDLRPLRALPSLVWVHVGGSRIEDLAPLDGLPGLTVAGPDDRDSPGARSDRAGRAGEQ